MTVAAAFNLKNQGILLCADTQHTWPGTMKLQSTKIFTKDNYASGLASAFVVCGDVHHCKTVIQHCEDELESAGPLARPEVRLLLRRAIGEAHRFYVFPDPAQPHVQLFAAIYCPKDRRLALLQSLRSSVNELAGYDVVGSGAVLGHYLIRDSYQRLRNRKGSLRPMFNLAVNSLKEIKHHVDGCGSATEVALLRPDGSLSKVVRMPTDTRAEWARGFARLKAR